MMCGQKTIKSVSIMYTKCVFVALVIQHAKHMGRYYIVICGLSGSTTFFHIISYIAQVSEKIMKYKMWIDFLYI
jgi:hypothetical protein